MHQANVPSSQPQRQRSRMWSTIFSACMAPRRLKRKYGSCVWPTQCLGHRTTRHLLQTLNPAISSFAADTRPVRRMRHETDSCMLLFTRFSTHQGNP
jgi:hypothetical protein